MMMALAIGLLFAADGVSFVVAMFVELLFAADGVLFVVADRGILCSWDGSFGRGAG